MKLLTEKLRRTLPPLYSTDGQRGDRKVHCKFFTPDSSWTWFVFEGEEKDGDVQFFGLVEGLETEMGYFSLNELEAARGPLGLPIERDVNFSGTLAEAAPEFCERLWG